MQKKFEKLLDFVKFMHEFREIVRYEGSKLGKLDAFENKDKKIAVSSDVYKYWQELLKEFKKNKKKLFPTLMI